MSSVVTEAYFLPRPGGKRFCVLRLPRDTPKGSVLFVHSFAEELNKSRRAVAETARALAQAGWAVLTLDLLGCGDSSGDFADATWEAWIEDVVAGHAWLANRFGGNPALWGLRVGCLILLGSLPRMSTTPDLVFWQPVVNGRAHLHRFLRLKSIGAIGGPTEAKVRTKSIEQQLETGESVEIAGYTLSSQLALPMASAELSLPVDYKGRLNWFEVSTSSEALSSAATARVNAMRSAGARVTATVATGLPFWQTQEIAECPALTEATVRGFESVAT